MNQEEKSELAVAFDVWLKTDDGRMARGTGEFISEPTREGAIRIALLKGAEIGDEVQKEIRRKHQRAIDATYEC